MIFYFYEEAMRPVRKISVDGLVPNSFHLSARVGNQTPKPFKGDTATESALKFIAHPEGASFFPYAPILTNNCFHTDALLSVFTLLNPKQAAVRAPSLMAAAESGTFSLFSSEEAVQMDLFLRGLVTDNSPFARSWKKGKRPKEELYYKTLLPLLPDLLDQRDKYSELWRKPFDAITTSMTMFERRVIGREEYPDERLTVIIDEAFPAPHAVDIYCKGDLFLMVQDCKRHEQGYRYILLYRYPIWAETLRRPNICRISMEGLAEELQKEEALSKRGSTGRWCINTPNRPPTGALLFSDSEGAWGLSRLEPDRVIQSVRSHIQKMKEKHKTQVRVPPPLEVRSPHRTDNKGRGMQGSNVRRTS